MPLAHGLYSVASSSARSAQGSRAARASGREPILLAIAVLIALTARCDRARARARHARGAAGLRFGRALVSIGIVGAAAFVVEGGIESWSALFLERQLHAEPSVSGLGPGVFGASMARAASSARRRTGSPTARCSRGRRGARGGRVRDRGDRAQRAARLCPASRSAAPASR